MSLTEIARYDNHFEAGLAQSTLEAEGIAAFLFDFEMANFYGSLAIPIRLMVDEDDVDQAKRILA